MIWAAFFMCVIIATAAMAWVSQTVLRLDEAEAAAQRRMQAEEKIRLALWRMDSTLAPVIAQENARPYSVYEPVRAEQLVNTDRQQASMVSMPLVASPTELLTLHFRLSPEGEITSPQVPSPGRLRTLVEAQGLISHEKILESDNRLSELRTLLDRDVLVAELPEPPPTTAPSVVYNVVEYNGANQDASINNAGKNPNTTAQTNDAANPNSLSANNWANGGGNQTALNNTAGYNRSNPNKKLDTDNSGTGKRDLAEYQARYNLVMDAVAQGNDDQRKRQVVSGVQVAEGYMVPMWLGSNLILARRVSIGGRQYIDGCRLDWEAVKTKLLDRVRADLLPNADLVPAKGDHDEDESRLLASLPVRLIPGDVPSDPQPKSPIRMILVIAWVSAGGGGLAIAMLLAGLIALSERRANFVSAVTHELRTPLTTLRMYTDMLSDGMVSDETRRKSYLATLRNEANRLGHLVENVLGYARLERRRSVGRIETTTAAALLETMQSRLEDHAVQNGYTLRVLLPDELADCRVLVDRVAVEQILFNLVDNSCKYGKPSSTGQIELSFAPQGRSVAITIADDGPGISPRHAKRLFKPFHKSVAEAALSAPGLGLGLAISRRLARSMGGDLSLESSDKGARFVLVLPN
jgi:signal transduction histidine kinase